jgi:HPt (histidine-containing phosphotransfer) domain-containing protein
MLSQARSQAPFVTDDPIRHDGRSSDGAAAAVDLARIQETSGGDLEFERELADVFLEDNDARALRLAEVLTAGDLPSAKREAHTLKGSSANVGASTLAAHAMRLEQACTTGDLGGAQHAFELVRDELARVKSFLRAYIASL